MFFGFTCRKGSNEEVSTEDNVKDAGHEKLNQLGSVDDIPTKLGAKALNGNIL